MRNYFLLFFLMSLSVTLVAQTPTLKVSENGKKTNLEIQRMHVSVEIIGNIAVTTCDMLFANHTNLILEGDFVLPLKADQEICRYALDINGELREGVVIEKVKARQTYETIVRRKIDPGIIQITKGNIFKTQIYPIPANGTKRVVIAWSENLSTKNNHLKYTLPLNSDQSIGNFKLNVNVLNKNLEVNDKINHQNFSFDKQHNSSIYKFERNNYIPSEAITFALPKLDHDKFHLFTHEEQGITFFQLQTSIPELSTSLKPTPNRIAIYWDISSSANNDQKLKEKEFLSQYLQMISKYNPKAKIDLYSFNIYSKYITTFKLHNNHDNIMEKVNSLEYDGATQIDNIFSTIKDYKYDEILLFSDGINTIGKDKIYHPLVKNEISLIPIHTIVSSLGSNYSLLKRVSKESDGRFIDLHTQDIDQAINELNVSKEKLINIKVKNGNAVEIYPKTPYVVDKEIFITGKMIGEEAMLILNFGKDGRITQTKTIAISAKKAKKHHWAKRAWASGKLDELSMNYETNRSEILNLSKKHSILSKGTSFIVLDNLRDYVTHEIVPPPSMQEAYYRMLKRKPIPAKVSHEQVLAFSQNYMNKLSYWYDNTKISQKKKTNFQMDSDLEEVIDIPQTTQPPPPPVNFSNDEREEEIEVDFDIEIEEDSELEEVILEEAPMEEEAVEEFSNNSSNSIRMRNNSGRAGYLKTKENISNKSSIKLLPWESNAEYLSFIKNASDENLESIYYSLKMQNLKRPAFFIQVADWYFLQGKSQRASEILSNIVEMDLENPELLKTTARRFRQAQQYSFAIELYKEILKLRPEEPQSYRDLALCLEESGDYQAAFDHFAMILNKEWGRFEPIKEVVLTEINHLITLHKDSIDTSRLDSSLIKEMPVDIKIVIDWSSNDNDIDLWVTDPRNEKCYYKNTTTKIKGKISKDFTQGYGPEEFLIKQAISGNYIVEINYYSESRQRITGPVTVSATMYTNYGRSNEKKEQSTAQLETGKKTLKIAELAFKPDSI
ncbi:VIT domain-containing protein [Aureibacter tunicatorum]|uniref:Tetratricopeptide (TPR) repeat protein n=1 Tax=Aureibacter tunicatorum TaxID=866807 RepID=A0AAE3XRF5_9BACT|nr:VIT domain-containing protein [Aureibacter tunicatorum]MDR6241383.1 tetratricopeptide (TPR) repeat protein [Aureibacter tunicatorum]BDD06772.1 hypothetical protein AUTU_42550 [Aureibacter tunicatorum]